MFFRNHMISGQGVPAVP